MLFVGVMKLRKTKPKMERPYKVPLYPIIPIVATVGGIFVVVSTLITQPKNSIVGLLITLIGLPVYEYTKRKNINQNNNNGLSPVEISDIKTMPGALLWLEGNILSRKTCLSCLLSLAAVSRT